MAVYPYATLANVKSRAGITDTTDDAVLGIICDQVNHLIEGYTHRAIGSSSGARYFDGEGLEAGRCLVIPAGIRLIRTLSIAPYTGATYSAIPSNDLFLRPVTGETEPGWPATEIWMSDVPSTGNPYPYFALGFSTILIDGDWGWSEMPPEVREVAEVTVIRAWQGRQSGESDQIGTSDIGDPVISRYLSERDRRTLDRYRWRPVDII